MHRVSRSHFYMAWMAIAVFAMAWAAPLGAVAMLCAQDDGAAAQEAEVESCPPQESDCCCDTPMAHDAMAASSHHDSAPADPAMDSCCCDLSSGEAPSDAPAFALAARHDSPRTASVAATSGAFAGYSDLVALSGRDSFGDFVTRPPTYLSHCALLR